MTEITLSDAAHIIRNSRRRLAIIYLEEHGQSRIKDLANYVTTVEHGPDNEYGIRHGIYICMYQDHIPQMEECGIVERGRNGDPISPGPHFDAVVAWLEAGLDRFTTEDQIRGEGLGGETIENVEAASD